MSRRSNVRLQGVRDPTPRNVGSKMLVFAEGKLSGSVGGGETERRVIEEAKKVLASEKPDILEYILDDPRRDRYKRDGSNCYAETGRGWDKMEYY